MTDMVNTLFSQDARRFVGKIHLGNETKKQIMPDGSVKETDWSTEDFFDDRMEYTKEQEGLIRNYMARDLLQGFIAQERFFETTEHPMKNASNDIIDCTAALMQRFGVSTEFVLEHYPMDEGESFWEAEVLEVVRRTTLKPTTILLEGYAQNGIHNIPGYKDEEFLQTREERMTPEMKRTEDIDEYHRLEHERIQKDLESRTEKEWIVIVEKQGIYLKGYLNRCINRALVQRRHTASFAINPIHEGRKLFNDDVFAALKQINIERINQIEEIQQTFAEIEKIQEVLPWIKQRFGEDSTFQTFLQFLNPVELTPDEQARKL